MDGETSEENTTEQPPVEGIFAAECILKKRLRKVSFKSSDFSGCHFMFCVGYFYMLISCVVLQGKTEYLIKWRGWTAK